MSKLMDRLFGRRQATEDTRREVASNFDEAMRFLDRPRDDRATSGDEPDD